MQYVKCFKCFERLKDTFAVMKKLNIYFLWCFYGKMGGFDVSLGDKWF